VPTTSPRLTRPTNDVECIESQLVPQPLAMDHLDALFNDNPQPAANHPADRAQHADHADHSAADASDLPAPVHIGEIEDPTAPKKTAGDGDLSDTFDTSKTFADLGLRNSVMKGIEACSFKYPTKTQAGLIPAVMEGGDVIGQAKTGTGKTAAFGIPLLCKLERDVPFQALVLAPTRELAIQITGEIEDIGRFTPIRAVTVYGGQGIQAQATKLEKGCQIIVGTPGRIMDMLERGHIHFKNVKHVVLDEVDRMLDIGFRDDIKKILGGIKQDHQTVLVSATISPDIERLARTHMKPEAKKIIVHSGSLTVNMVKQFYLPVNHWDKKRLLLHLLRHEEPALTIVFCRLKRHVDEIAEGLSARGIEARAIHGDMSQSKRNSTMQQLRGGKMTVLVASDLASRGIDVEGITHVINFDLPEDPEVYVHRIGRTARAGRDGVAWSFVTPDQGELLTNIELLINAEVPKLEYPDFEPRETPPDGFRAPTNGRPQGGLTVVQAPGAAPTPAPPPQQKINRMETGKPVLPVANTAAPDPTKFPGGIVPTKLPPKMMIKGVKRR